MNNELIFLLFGSWATMFLLGFLIGLVIERKRVYKAYDDEERFKENLSQENLVKYYTIKRLYRGFEE